MNVVELVGVKLSRKRDKEVANQKSRECCGLHREKLLVLLVRWAPKAGEFDSR